MSIPPECPMSTVEVAVTPRDLHINAMLSPFLYSPRSRPLIRVIEKLSRVRKQGKIMQHGALSSTEGESMESTSQIVEPLVVRQESFQREIIPHEAQEPRRALLTSLPSFSSIVPSVKWAHSCLLSRASCSD